MPIKSRTTNILKNEVRVLHIHSYVRMYIRTYIHTYCTEALCNPTRGKVARCRESARARDRGTEQTHTHMATFFWLTISLSVSLARSLAWDCRVGNGAIFRDSQQGNGSSSVGRAHPKSLNLLQSRRTVIHQSFAFVLAGPLRFREVYGKD